ncbi:MAG: hypothetical protein GF308_18935 [Candidatus Heimdallarchaeota archaeon]|nr:hypothetical protein [Candidatus Heimdallarchaeota archaeon]
MNEKTKVYYTLGIFFLLLSFVLIDSIIVSAYYNNTQTSDKAKAVKNWTVMLYFCADSRDHHVTESLDNSGNFIHQALSSTHTALQLHDLLAGAESNLNVISLYDYPYSPSHPYGYAKIFSIWSNDHDTVAEWGQKNLGSYWTLKAFIDYCKTNFPANNYALFLSDHGRGYAGFCYDYHASHPYYEYALGDCLTVEEVGRALVDTGGVDVLFLNTCLGGSFEAMWEFAGSVEYAVAGESSQTAEALYHPRDVLYALSRDTSMSSLELAQVGFDAAVDPERIPDDPFDTYQWPSVSLYDVSSIDIIPSIIGPPIYFKEIFEDYTQLLYDQLTANLTVGRELFGQIRNECVLPCLDAKYMMVDLGHFINRTLAHSAEFTFQEDLETLANSLLFYLSESVARIVVEEAHRVFYSYSNLTGFSLCFPNTKDMYQEFLYPNLYETLLISDESYWDEFIFTLYPTKELYKFIPLRDYYEIHIGPIDPTIHLHVLIDELYLEEPMHVGYCPFNTNDYNMGIEVGIPGAGFVDTLIQGTCTIHVPTASIPGTRDGSAALKIIVNGSSAASASLPANLTVRHVKDKNIIWEANQVENVELGQVLSCEVSTEEDEWTDLTPEEPNITPPTTTGPPNTSEPPNTTEETTSRTGFIGPSLAFISSSVGLLASLVIILSYTKKKKKRFPRGK